MNERAAGPDRATQTAIEQTIAFLREGRFKSSAVITRECG
jgi:hypothetical protein